MSHSNLPAARLERLVDALEALILESEAAELAELASSGGTSVREQAAQTASGLARRRARAPSPSPDSPHGGIIRDETACSVLPLTLPRSG